MILAGFGGNGWARDASWSFVKKQWKTLTARYKGGSVGLLGHILEGATMSFVTQAAYEDVKSFFHAHPIAGTERTMKQALEVIAANRRWAERDRRDVGEWLAHL